MASNSHQSAAAAAATAQSDGYSYDYLLQQQPEQLQIFWTSQRQEIEQIDNFKNHKLPISRTKKIMKSDKDIRMISAEAPILFAKACEIFIQELTLRSWLYAQECKRRTLEKRDFIEAIKHTDIFDFLVDVVPMDEIEEQATGFGPGMVDSPLSGVPFCYPPMGQPAPSMRQPAPPGVTIGRRAMPWVDPSVYVRPPLQPWQSVWQAADDNSYATGGNGGQGNHDPQS
ncbi:nuclear transcription factor Y subunit C-1-like isoform X3 [Solanum dulcamara]|uniref:nuclear transcription factor Y subunit C-1-like isoform X3 n=1 Tax=Solanum dulcamara TaxID=45834 RepID=UPI0024857CEB|nr:nuclear transcription factor Y subunit C-1-like isoform X3 [Solanum dulcamara]